MRAADLLLIFGLITSTTSDQPFHLLLIPSLSYHLSSTLLEEINNDKVVAFDYKQSKMRNLSTEVLKEHCVKNKGEDTWREFEENIRNFAICLNNPFNSWVFCKNNRTSLHKCLEAYSEKLSLCEGDEGKNLLLFHINSTTKMADYICEKYPYLQNPNVLQKINANCLLKFLNYFFKRDVESSLKDVRECMKEKQASNLEEEDQTKSYCNSQIFLHECVLNKVNIYCDPSGPVWNIVEDIFFNGTFSLCNNKYNFTLS